MSDEDNNDNNDVSNNDDNISDWTDQEIGITIIERGLPNTSFDKNSTEEPRKD
ncbi:MAG: hypothetical protein ACYCXK_11840 [Candidatus Humimicrobiaceae bacterium]